MKGSTTLSAAAVAAAASKALPPWPSSLAPAWAASGWAAATMPWSEVMLGRLPCMMLPASSTCRWDRWMGDNRLQGGTGRADEFAELGARPPELGTGGAGLFERLGGIQELDVAAEPADQLHSEGHAMIVHSAG